MFKSLLVSAVLTLTASSAFAASLDFSELGTGFVGTTNAQITGAELTSGGTDIFVFEWQGNTGICAARFSCANDMEINFTETVEGLVFDARSLTGGDTVDLYIYDQNNMLAGIYTINGNEQVDLSAFGPIGRLYFDDTPSGFGFVYANFEFEISPIPLPAGMSLMAGALGLMALSRRRRAKT